MANPVIPVIELLTENILSTLQNITTANGCWYTITAEREKRRGNKIEDCKVIIFQKDPQLDSDAPLLKTQWVQPFSLEIFIAIPDDQNDTITPSEKLNKICSDIHLALMQDRHRNNLAIDTNIEPWADFQSINGSYDGRQFNVNCKYRTMETDPTQQ